MHRFVLEVLLAQKNRLVQLACKVSLELAKGAWSLLIRCLELE